MDQEIKEGRGCGPHKDYVLLKLDHLGPEVIMKRLPSIREIALKFANVDPHQGADPRRADDPLPDGRRTDQLSTARSWRRRTATPKAVVNGLYAVGECACVSVHGANRLGTNSLLDLSCSDARPAIIIVDRTCSAQSHKPLPRDAADLTLARLARLDGADVAASRSPRWRSDLREAMQAHCGVFRNQELPGRGRAQGDGDRAARRMRTAIKDRSRTFNTARVEALELDNLIETAKATDSFGAKRAANRAARRRAATIPNRDDANWLEAHAVVSRRQPPRVQAGEPEAAVGGSVSAEGADVLTDSEPDQ